MSDATAQLLLASPNQGGPGTLLRTLIVVSVVGTAFLAWFLLRGYGGRD